MLFHCFCVEGVIGGKFLKRGRVKKPGQELFKSEMSEYFTAQDLYVGARLDLNNQPFQLLDADEFTFNYMEQHADEVTQKKKTLIKTVLHRNFIEITSSMFLYYVVPEGEYWHHY